jgi:hypothetical protein
MLPRALLSGPDVSGEKPLAPAVALTLDATESAPEVAPTSRIRGIDWTPGAYR